MPESGEQHRTAAAYASRVGRVRVRAHAKINLCLHVGQPEPATSEKPGWHRVHTHMHAIDLHDDIILTRVPQHGPINHRVSWVSTDNHESPVEWPIDSDLAVRALRALEAHTGQTLAVEIVVRKDIPAGGGLGGGSSDAAAVLIGVNLLCNLHLNEHTLQQIALQLGSDVAFFVDMDRARHGRHDADQLCLETTPRPAIVSGFGGTIERTDRVHGAITLIIPSFGCNSAEVYHAFDAITPQSHVLLPCQIDNPSFSYHTIRNDLEGAACHVHPELRTMLSMMRRQGISCYLTGSGSTIVAHRDLNDIAFAAISQQHRALWKDTRRIGANLC
ncbi:MAG: hypothetical protein H6815_02890 [Phycisphaeraceae bacterium]|nr:hypothetical protein [Phycisphaerales bacterium]MCB9859373.1 hypothetical protein [Phycisphaeraceae bacterium]